MNVFTCVCTILHTVAFMIVLIAWLQFMFTTGIHNCIGMIMRI